MKNPKASEFRIGNLIHLGNKNQDIIINWAILGNINSQNFFCKDYLPIPINKEWLEKFGFVFTYGVWLKATHETRIKVEYAGSHCQLIGVVEYIGKPFEYVHQLQNLYFALTGEELILKFSKQCLK